MPLNITKKTPAKAPKQSVKPTTAVVTKQMPDGSESSTSEVVGHELVAEPSVSINIGIGLTRQTAPYESIKFYVSITMPSTPEEIEETYVTGKNWVDTKVNEINEEVDALIGNKD